MAEPPDRPATRVPFFTPGPRVLMRLALIGAVLAILCSAFAWTAGWLPPRRLTQTGMIDALRAVDGRHRGFRSNHAKGVCVTGWFEGNGQASRLSTASVLRAGRSPVVGRFALAGGMPFQADAPAKVRSMALRIMPPDGQEWRMGLNDIPVFVARTAQEFHDLLLATRPDPTTGKPDPARVGPFMATHPNTARAAAQVAKRSITSGFADDTYRSLDAFRFIDADGVVVPVRWAMVPLAPVQAPAARIEANTLFDGLIAALRQGPLQWRLMISIGTVSDPTSDPTVAWPADRDQVDAGTLTLNRAESEDNGPCTGITYDPTILPVGIAASDDPILPARSSAYMRSFVIRSGETKPPSAVSPASIGPGGQP
ncbi:catalase family peroxidase [Acetobacter sp. TBRC 12305]|uniref:Catalase-related peroxidase n=2 Tax=Acetobacter garciniae TaxID=2817435 RepID=A0A939HIQ0_9PROT|nr:catalase family peroxidase [Acetobacter garciniae]MBX0344861.1 catalase family peroxidase [Acetobacter garciniae]